MATKKKANPSAVVSHWLSEIEDSKRREKDFRTEGKRILGIYEAEKKTRYSFNILYSNTETLTPSLYTNTPRPRVQRRFKDDDPVGAEASKVCQRGLEYLLDSGDPTYTPFDELMQSAVVEALVPGRGVTRFKYDAEVARGEDGEESLSYETVCGEEVPWDRFYHGYAKKWKDVPWVAYEHFMDRQELIDNFGDLGRQVKMSKIPRSGDVDEGSWMEQSKRPDVDLACVFEVWDKDSRQVIFVSEGLKEAPLRQVDDPLKLVGFFPSPRPLGFFNKISTLTPTPLYAFYEEQAAELNQITLRIARIIKAMRVRGFYNAQVEGFEELFKADENELLPLTNAAALGDGGALDRGIWMLPIEHFISALQQLYVNREQTKGIIYEVTGISDIIRGSTQASESATAQRLKDRWGTLRLRKMQKEVQRYARDCLRIMAEIAATKLGQEVWAGMTGLDYPTEQEAQAQMQAQMMEQQQMMMQAQGAGPEGMPPAEGGMPPEAMMPPEPPEPPITWEQILGVLENDLQRSYKIDIETNSTLDADATEDKQNMGEFMNAMSQFLMAVTPLVENGTLPFDAAKAIMLQMSRRFAFGPEVEEELKQMVAPEPKDEEDEAVKAEKEALEAEKAAFNEQKLQAEMKFKQQEMELDFQRREFELEQKFAMKEFQLEQKMAAQEQEMRVEKGVREIESQMEALSQGTRQEIARVEAGQQAFQKVSERSDQGTEKLVTKVEEAQREMREAITAMAGVIEGLTKAQTATRRISDGKGRTLTVESILGDMQ